MIQYIMNLFKHPYFRHGFRKRIIFLSLQGDTSGVDPKHLNLICPLIHVAPGFQHMVCIPVQCTYGGTFKNLTYYHPLLVAKHVHPYLHVGA